MKFLSTHNSYSQVCLTGPLGTPYRGALIENRNVKMSRALGRGARENCPGKGYIEDILSVGRLQKHMLEVFENPLGYFGPCSHVKLAWGHLLLKEQGVQILPVPTAQELFTQCSQISCPWPFLEVILGTSLDQRAASGSSVCAVGYGDIKACRSPAMFYQKKGAHCIINISHALKQFL